MGNISTGKPYQGIGLQFELTLDEPVSRPAAPRLTAQILRVSGENSPRLYPSSFIPWTDGSKKATVTFAEQLEPEQLAAALRIICNKLISRYYLDVMPQFPDPLWTEG